MTHPLDALPTALAIIPADSIARGVQRATEREDEMPSGPPELHEYWCNKDPDGSGDWAAIRYLKSKNYTLLPTFFWVKPSPDHVPTAEENMALNYLWWEWDFGGIKE